MRPEKECLLDSESTGAAAPEARLRRKRLKYQLSALAFTIGLGIHPAFAQTVSATTLPTGGSVVAGAASIKQSGSALTVTTATNTTAINWNSFSIGQNASVAINQPTASSITVNQVTGVSPSQIFGALKSNGQVVVTNPYGIWFGPSAHIDVAGLVASTASASPGAISDFAKGMALRLDQAGLADASVVNDGHITVASTGLAALVAPGVASNGVIVASLGTVQLGSANTAVVDFYGDGLVHFAVGDQITAAPKGPDGKPLAAAVSNTGKLVAPGGRITMTASAVKGVVDNAINMSGVARVSSAHGNGGDIVLDGGDGATNVSGKLDASSKTGTGGLIQVTGNAVNVASTAKVRADGATGGAVQVGGGSQGTGPLAHALTVDIATGAVITASGNAGAGGNIAVWSDGTTKVAGTLTATGTTTGGIIETSGEDLDITGVTVNAGPGGQWLIDPQDLTIDSTLAATIVSTLNAGTAVTLTTTGNAPTISPNSSLGAFTSGTNGDITVSSAIVWTSNAALTLTAAGSINVNAKIDNDSVVSLGNAGVSSGAINLTAGNNIQVGAALIVGGGSIGLTAVNAIAFGTGGSLAASGPVVAGRTYNGSFSLSGQSVTIGQGNSLTTNTGAINISGSTVTVQGTVTGGGLHITGGNVDLQSNAVVTANGDVSIILSGTANTATGSQLNTTGSVTIQAGNITLNGAITAGSFVSLAAGSNGTTGNTGTLNLSATSAITASQLNILVISQFYMADDIIVLNGAITTTGDIGVIETLAPQLVGVVDTQIGGTIISQGGAISFSDRDGQMVFSGGSITDTTGNVQFSNMRSSSAVFGTTVSAAGVQYVFAGATAQSMSAQQLAALSSQSTGILTVINSSGALSITGTATIAGGVTLQAPTLTISGASITAGGPVSLQIPTSTTITGSTVKSAKALTVDTPVLNLVANATIEGASVSVIDLATSNSVFAGTIQADSGNLTISALQPGVSYNFTGMLSQNGTGGILVTTGTGGSITNTGGTMTTNGGSITLDAPPATGLAPAVSSSTPSAKQLNTDLGGTITLTSGIINAGTGTVTLKDATYIDVGESITAGAFVVTAQAQRTVAVTGGGPNVTIGSLIEIDSAINATTIAFSTDDTAAAGTLQFDSHAVFTDTSLSVAAGTYSFNSGAAYSHTGFAFTAPSLSAFSSSFTSQFATIGMTYTGTTALVLAAGFPNAGASSGVSITAPNASVTLTGTQSFAGSLSITAQNVTVGTVTAGSDITLTGQFGSVITPVTVTGGLTSTNGAITINANDAELTGPLSSAGAITLTAGTINIGGNVTAASVALGGLSRLNIATGTTMTATNGAVSIAVAAGSSTASVFLGGNISAAGSNGRITISGGSSQINIQGQLTATAAGDTHLATASIGIDTGANGVLGGVGSDQLTAENTGGSIVLYTNSWNLGGTPISAATIVIDNSPSGGGGKIVLDTNPIVPVGTLVLGGVTLNALKAPSGFPTVIIGDASSKITNNLNLTTNFQLLGTIAATSTGIISGTPSIGGATETPVTGKLYIDNGTTLAGSGVTVELIVGGVIESAATTTNGAFTVFLTGSTGSVSLLLVSEGSSPGNTLYNGFFSVAGTGAVDIWANTLRVTARETTFSAITTDLNTAAGSIVDSHILYENSALKANAALNIIGTGGTLNFNQPLNLPTNALTIGYPSGSFSPVIFSDGTYTLGSFTTAAPVQFGTNLTIDTSADNGNISMPSLDGSGAVTIKNGTGTLSLGGLGTTTTPSSLTVTGTVDLTGTIGNPNIAYRAGTMSLGAIILEADDELDTTANLTVGSVTAGTHALNLFTSGGVLSVGNISSTAQVTLSVNQSTVTLTGSSYSVGRLSGNSAIISGGTVSLAGTIALNNILLGGNTTITSPNVTLNLAASTINTQNHALTISGSGLTLTLGQLTNLGTVDIEPLLTNLTSTSYSFGQATFGAIQLGRDTTFTVTNTGSLTLGSVDAGVTGTIPRLTVSAPAMTFTAGATINNVAATVTNLVFGNNDIVNTFTNTGTVTIGSGDTVSNFTNTGTVTLSGTLNATGFSTSTIVLASSTVVTGTNITAGGVSGQVAASSVTFAGSTLTVNGTQIQPPTSGTGTSGTGGSSFDITGTVYISLTNPQPLANVKVDLLIDGVAYGGEVTTDANGAFDFSLASGVPATSVLATGYTAIVYLNGSQKGATFRDYITSPLSGIALYTNTLTLMSSAATLAELDTDFKTALGSITGANANLASIVAIGANAGMTVASGIGTVLLAPTATNFALDQALNAASAKVAVLLPAGGSFTEASTGSVTASGLGILDAGSSGAAAPGGSVTLNGTNAVSSFIADLDNGASFTLGSTGSITSTASGTKQGLDAGFHFGNNSYNSGFDIGSGVVAVTLNSNGSSAGTTVTLNGAITAQDMTLITSDTQHLEPGTIAIGGTARITLKGTYATEAANQADSFFYTGAQGKVTVAIGATIDAGSQNLMLAGDTVTVAGTVTGTGTVILLPGSWTGSILPNNDAVATNNQAITLSLPNGVSAASIGIGGGTGTMQISQSTLTALGGVGMIQIGTPGGTGMVTIGSGQSTVSTGNAALTIYSPQISVSGTLNVGGTLTLDEPIQMSGTTTLTSANGDITLGATTGQQSLVLKALNGTVFVDGDFGTSSSRLNALEIDAQNAKVLGNPTFSLWVQSFVGNVAQSLDPGNNSIQSSGGVTISAGTLTGHVVATNANISATTISSGSTISATQTASIAATNMSGNVSAANVTVSATNITGGSINATQSATVKATQNISGISISAATVSVAAGGGISDLTVAATLSATVQAVGTISGGSVVAPTRIVASNTGTGGADTGSVT